MAEFWNERYEQFVGNFMTSYELTMLSITGQTLRGVRTDWKWDEVGHEAQVLSLSGAAGVASMYNGFRYFMIAESESDAMAQVREGQASDYFTEAEGRLRSFGPESKNLLEGIAQMKTAVHAKRKGFLGRKKRLNLDLMNYLMGGGFLVAFLDVARHHTDREAFIARLDPRTPPSLIPLIQAA